MPAAGIQSVDDYLARQPDGVRGVLARVRAAIRRTAPAADESISYGLPTYKLHGRPLIYFAGWKAHYSIYPATTALVAALRDDLAACEVETGTIRLPYSGRFPARLIAKIVRFRTGEVAAPLRTAAGVRGGRQRSR